MIRLSNQSEEAVANVTVARPDCLKFEFVKASLINNYFLTSPFPNLSRIC